MGNIFALEDSLQSEIIILQTKPHNFRFGSLFFVLKSTCYIIFHTSYLLPIVLFVLIYSNMVKKRKRSYKFNKPIQKKIIINQQYAGRNKADYPHCQVNQMQQTRKTLDSVSAFITRNRMLSNIYIRSAACLMDNCTRKQTHKEYMSNRRGSCIQVERLCKHLTRMEINVLAHNLFQMLDKI